MPICPFENFESAAHAVCRHTTNYAHSLFNKNINLFAVCSWDICLQLHFTCSCTAVARAHTQLPRDNRHWTCKRLSPDSVRDSIWTEISVSQVPIWNICKLTFVILHYSYSVFPCLFIYLTPTENLRRLFAITIASTLKDWSVRVLDLDLVTQLLTSPHLFDYYDCRVLRAICCQPVDGSLICFM